MNLADLVVAPVLIKVVIDDKETIKEYKEPIVFYTPDRQPLDVFIKLSSALGSDQATSISILRSLVLDEEGKEVLQEGKMLKPALMVKVLAKVMELLGK
jgi:hypothetical protein